MAELTSVADIKTYAGITSATDDTLLGVLLDAAEDMLRRYCDRLDGWSDAEFTEKIDGSGRNTFIVTNTPVFTSPSPVVVIRSSATSTETVDAGGYRFDTETGEFRYTGGAYWGFDFGWDADTHCPRGWPEGFQNIEVTYTGGYTTIPEALTQAAKDATLWLYYQRRDDKSMVSETRGAYSYTRWQPIEGHELPPQVEMLANPFRRGSGVAV